MRSEREDREHNGGLSTWTPHGKARKADLQEDNIGHKAAITGFVRQMCSMCGILPPLTSMAARRAGRPFSGRLAPLSGVAESTS